MKPETILPASNNERLVVKPDINIEKNNKQNLEKVAEYSAEKFEQVAENQLKSEIQLNEFSKQIKSHLALIQEYRKENKAWRHQTEKRIRKELKDGKQTKLGEFI